MQKLFSYGTLQLESVQLDTFGRLLEGKKDALVGYRIDELKIRDQEVINSSGTDTHPILVYSGNSEDKVEGCIFEITEEELLQADRYEVDDYKRQLLTFESGNEAYAYIVKR